MPDGKVCIWDAAPGGQAKGRINPAAISLAFPANLIISRTTLSLWRTWLPQRSEDETSSAEVERAIPEKCCEAALRDSTEWQPTHRNNAKCRLMQ
jgi:hypothetical protein